MPDDPHHEEAEWEPPLPGGPDSSARRFYYDPSPFVMAHGERGSGKTMAALHKDVRHAYIYDDALVVIVTVVKNKEGGVWEDLTSMAVWEDGPLKGQPKGILETWRQGFGLEYGNFGSTAKEKEIPWTTYQDQAKNFWVDIRNVHGGISKIMYKSMKDASQVIARVKDLRPSLFHFEEVGEHNNPVFFTGVIQQLGRRGSVPAHAQQWVGTQNPPIQGQKHWTFSTFFVDPHELILDEKEKDQHIDDHTFEPTVFHPHRNPGGHIRKWNERFSVHHVKMTENDMMDPIRKEQYIATLIESARSDPTEYDRVILGKWVPKMAGNALFLGYWDKSVHLRGRRSKGEFLPARVGEPIIIGYDPGSKNNGRVFLQRNVVNERVIWRAIDESFHNDKKLRIDILVKEMLDRMLEWCLRHNHRFGFLHISDNQALTHYNHQGNYEWKEYYRISKELIAANPDYRKWLTPIRMVAPEKGAGSVEQRVKMMQDLLLSNSFYVSSRCVRLAEMFDQLRKARDTRGGTEHDFKPRKDGKGFIHLFDAATYPVYYFALQGKVMSAPPPRSSDKKLAYASG
jgi:hypothetical protein